MRYMLVVLLCLASIALAQQKPRTITPKAIRNDTTAQLSIKDQLKIIEDRQAALKLEFEKDFARLEGMKQILQQIAADSITIKTK